MSESGKKEIIIDLSTSSNAKKYEKDSIVHQREIERVQGLINNRLLRPDDENIRYNDTISIIGSRGSGKTSFLHTLLNSYKKDVDIQVLPIIDPTLIEEKGHIFLVIISLIQSLINDKLDKNDCNPHEKGLSLKKEWKEKLRKLAAGFPTLDGVGGSGLDESNWQDSEYILDKGLKSVKSAIELEQNFDELLIFALKALDKKLFIISLDDIDVDFKKGWPVLETIRKYLTSSRLVVLLSGDFELFTKAIRKQQWKNFGKALLKNEFDQQGKIENYNNLVTEMESQYLQKVLKPENRIHLSTLYEKINLYKDKVYIIYSQNDGLNKNLISNYYSKILSLFGIKNPYQAEGYSSYLLDLPLRSQIQFLQQYKSLSIDEKTNITDAFLSDLYEKEVDIKLASNLPKMLNIVILKLLLKERNLSESYQLQPTTDNATLNGSLTALSFLFSKQSQENPYLIFDYIIRIGYIRNLLSVIEYKTEKIPYSIEELCKSSGAFQDKVLRDVAGNFTAYLRGVLNANGTTPKNYEGVIELTGLAVKAKGKKKEFRIDEVFKDATDEERKIAYIPVSTSVNNWSNSSIVSASFFVLLASIGELIRKGLLRKIEFDKNDDRETVKGEVEINKLQREKDIALGILELSQIRSYLMPDFGKYEAKKLISFEINDGDDEYDWDTQDDPDRQAEVDEVIDVAKYIKEWIDRYSSNGKMIVSPHLLGKISTRFYFALEGISHTRKFDNFGDYFYRMIIALANAVVIEELKEVGPTIEIKDPLDSSKGKTYNDLNINNTITSNFIFNKNISIAEKYKAHLPFSQWLLSCPLFLLYLPFDCNEEQSKTKKSYLDFIESSYNDLDIKATEIWCKTIYPKLYNVQVASVSKAEFEKKRSKEGKTEVVGTSPIQSLLKFENTLEIVMLLISKNVKFKLFENKYEKKIMKTSDLYKTCSKYLSGDVNKSSVKSFVDFVKKQSDNDEIIKSWIQPQL